MKFKYLLSMILSLGIVNQALPINIETAQNALIAAAQHVNSNKLTALLSLGCGLSLAAGFNANEEFNIYAAKDEEEMMKNGTYGKEALWNKIKRNASYLVKKLFFTSTLTVISAAALYRLNILAQANGDGGIAFFATILGTAFMTSMHSTM